MNLTLAYKGILLVGVLLALEFTFVGALIFMLNQVEQESAREAHSKEIVGKTNHVFQLITDAGIAAADYQKRGGDPMDAAKYHAACDKIPAELESLKTSVQNDPQSLQVVEKIDKETKTAIKMVSFMMNLCETGRMAEAIGVERKLGPVFRQSREKLIDELREFMKKQEALIAESPAAQAKSRQIFKQLLMVGLGFNVVIAVAIALFLVRGITSRLSFVVDNTKRLTRHEPLNDPLPGTDEIAQLDHSFHDMARKLREVEEMKQQFLAMVSHDLRSPMTSTHGLLGSMMDGTYGNLSETLARRVAAAERDLMRLLKMINDLLDIERLAAGGLELDYQRVFITDTIRSAMDAIQSFADANEVSLRTRATDLEVVVDNDRLVQVLVNLISNSVKFSPKGAAVSTLVEEDGDFFTVKVVDQGRGVPASMRESIFERFKQVEKGDATKKKGTGLGLPICKALVELHHGTIGVTSEDGKGSTFWFRIPKQP